MPGNECSSGCPAPPAVPWYRRLWHAAVAYATWPGTVRELRRAGARRTGFMTWEL